jgi:hypothetical protein
LLIIARSLSNSPALSRSPKETHEILLLCALAYILYELLTPLCEDWLALFLLLVLAIGNHFLTKLKVVSPFLNALGDKVKPNNKIK